MAKTIYKKKIKNGKEYYFYRLRHKNLVTPKDLYALTVKDLDEKIKNLLTDLDYNIIDTKESFEAFFINWLFEVRFLTLKPSTKERYESVYRNYIKNSPLSNIKIKDMALADVQGYYNKLVKEGHSVNCLKMINKLISPCIRYAFNNSILIRDFTGAIVLPKESEETKLNKANKVQPFALDEQKRFVKAIKNHELEILFITALNSGLRQGELLALTWNDINFDRHYIDVNKNAKYVANVSSNGREHSKMIIQTPKTIKSTRKVSIPPSLTEQLKIYRFKQLEQKSLLANLYQDNNLVFCTKFGKYLDSGNIRKRFNKVINSINDNEKDQYRKIAPRKFHDLRHTYATRLFELGEKPKTVQELLGHSDTSVTLGTYTHVLESMKVIAASKLDDLYMSMQTD
ncbi:tyrosine-type recombinase/integrase [Clostridium beijerinckii]|uniref:Site-specific integrase n=1 Tax=Clostridium beijerinckii TaxID=1520 RepID=A0AAW3W9X4_CLOBE|nr:site-specific integrase [Clostridium beijerinckii]MBC2457052.1 site-specific integrase [Clostridium beijerinckii]MBC2475624.1 site-specific integrase [Clostridium beijerinckii]NOV63072.1 integrase [Clostridium beijerinckii]NOV69966.1 integrase [Clostridium beijerinckii]NOW31127.1 integrase [Clostridium beijerinckii]